MHAPIRSPHTLHRDADKAHPAEPTPAGPPPAARHRTALVALGLCAGVFLVVVSVRRGLFDLDIYYGAVNFWIAGGDLYGYLSPPTERGHRYGFTYPPFAALTMSPMSLVGWPTAVVVSTLLTVGSAGLVLHRLLAPIARRHRWRRGPVVLLAASVTAFWEPLGSNLAFGQINLILVLLVVLDAELLRTGRHRFAGVGIGLAAAIKLTPAVFVLYLLVAGQPRAAVRAVGTAAGATVLAAVVAPAESWAFWTRILWNTGRVGDPAAVSNQSLYGVVARLGVPLGRWWWSVAVLAVLAVWVVRVRRAAAVQDHRAGLALTAVLACLVSPVTWMHHLVWLLPALVVLADAGLRGPEGRRRAPVPAAAALVYLVMCSRVVWLWADDHDGVGGFVGGNLYVWISLGLLVALPRRDARHPELRPAPVPGAPRPAGAGNPRPAGRFASRSVS